MTLDPRPLPMVINDLEFYLVRIECDGGQTPLQSLLVRLATDAGLEGWGEAQLPWRVSELAPRRDVLQPILAGRSVFDVEELLELEALDSPQLRSALEMASWDLIGRLAGQPLCRLLGGEYRERIPVAVRLPAAPDGQMTQLARELADQGFHAQIVTSCGRWERDLETLRTVREGAGERVEWQFDAASGYDVDTARALCAELESDTLKFVLDPLQANDLDQIASLRRQTSVPLAVGRAVRSAADVLAVVRSGAAPFVVVDLGLVGGIAPARRCAAIAQAAGLSASLGTAPSAGVGVAAMLQLAASTPAFSSCNQCAYRQLRDDLLTEPLELLDGMLTVPQAPGLGIEVDRTKVERYQVT